MAAPLANEAIGAMCREAIQGSRTGGQRVTHSLAGLGSELAWDGIGMEPIINEDNHTLASHIFDNKVQICSAVGGRGRQQADLVLVRKSP